MILTAWNLSKVMAASGRLSATLLMKAGLISMQTSLTASGAPRWAVRSWANAAPCRRRGLQRQQHAGLVDIDEQRDIAVASPRGGFVDGDPRDAGGVGAPAPDRRSGGP